MTASLKSEAELSQYCAAQYVALQKAAARIRQLEQEVDHLKALLVSASPLIGTPQVEFVPQSAEQVLCESQIERLKQVGLDRDLTLEETKRLDLYIKNLYAIKKHNRDIDAKGHTLGALSEAELVALAQLPEPTQEA